MHPSPPPDNPIQPPPRPNPPLLRPATPAPPHPPNKLRHLNALHAPAAHLRNGAICYYPVMRTARPRKRSCHAHAAHRRRRNQSRADDGAGARVAGRCRRGTVPPVCAPRHGPCSGRGDLRRVRADVDRARRAPSCGSYLRRRHCVRAYHHVLVRGARRPRQPHSAVLWAPGACVPGAGDARVGVGCVACEGVGGAEWGFFGRRRRVGWED
jgi:hypothetical protein